MASLTDIYFPKYSEIPPEQFVLVRERLRSYIRQGRPDLDTRPNSVFGDLFVAPQGDAIAALEIAMGRFMSDLDLENTANGITYDCDFVRAFLNNFAVVETENLKSQGVVRFRFNSDAPRLIDRRVRVAFGDVIYRLKLASEGGLFVKPVGSNVTFSENSAPLRQLSPGVYVVDWVVEGGAAADEAVTSGDPAEIDITLPGLQEVTAVTDFTRGQPDIRLQDLAKKTRTTFYSASMNSRGSARRMLLKEFPALNAVSPVLSGDAELMRDQVNALGLSEGALDVHVKSGVTVTAEAVVRLAYISIQAAQPLECFIGKLNIPGIALSIDSITSVASSAVNLGLAEGTTKILSLSKAPSKAPDASCSYSELEELWVVIPMPKDPLTGAPLVPLDVSPTGEVTADFLVTYRVDPILPSVAAFAGSPNYAPVGVSTLVRGFLPFRIDALTVTYNRSPGVTVNIGKARVDIAAYLNGLGGPEATYSDSRVYDIMHWTGALDVVGIACSARLLWSVASFYMDPEAPTPLTGWVACLAAATPVKSITAQVSSALIPTYSDPSTFESVGRRNVGYLIKPENIEFVELL